MTAKTDPSLGELTRTFARIGCLSFGGPAAQIALMHRVILDEKRWVDEADYLRALSFCMLLPGPEAMQLATWIGWRLHGVRGGLIAGGLFVLPGALVVLGLSLIYAGLRAGAAGRGAVRRRAGRRDRHRDRGADPRLETRPEIARGAGHRGRGLCWACSSWACRSR
jgi:hypothetical protein